MTSERKDIIKMLLAFCFKANIIEAGTEKGHSFYLLKQVAGMLDSETEDAARKRKTQQKNEMLLLPRPPQSDLFRKRKSRAKQWCIANTDTVEIPDIQNNKVFSGYYYLAIKRDGGRCRQCGSLEQVRAYNYTGVPINEIALDSLITLCDICYKEIISNHANNNHDSISKNAISEGNNNDVDVTSRSKRDMSRNGHESVTQMSRNGHESVTNLLPSYPSDEPSSTSTITELEDIQHLNSCHEGVTLMSRNGHENVTQMSRKIT